MTFSALQWRHALCARETVQLLSQETPDFISPDLRPPNSLVDYRIWGLMQERVNIVQTLVCDTSDCDQRDVKQRLIDTWASISQNVIDEAAGQRRKRLRANIKAKGHHFKHLLN